LYEGDEVAEDGVIGKPDTEPVPGCETCLRGDEGRRCLLLMLFEDATLKFGELFRSVMVRSSSRTEVRTGEVGKASSTCFRGVRTLLGDPDGLLGRIRGE
jgi:hypothetical protein